jgi:hypothetical protein
MPEFDLVPETPEQRQAAMLAFSAILGGGVVAYELARSVREGDLLATDKLDVKPEAGPFAMGVGLVALGFALKEAAAQVGWKPLVLGSVGIFGFAVVARAIRG